MRSVHQPTANTLLIQLELTTIIRPPNYISFAKKSYGVMYNRFGEMLIIEISIYYR